MIHIKKNYPAEDFSCHAFEQYFTKQKLGILDIETTGLSPANSKIILGGLIFCQAGSLCLEQFFAESVDEEDALLSAYLETISRLDTIVTFNGKHFDLSFIKKRAATYGISCQDGMPHNLDLYLLLNGYSTLRKLLPNLKQKTVENYFGLWSNRFDEISGAESIDLYYEYCATKSQDTLDKILLHNHDDLLQLYKLIPIMGKSDIHRAMFSLGFPVGDLSVEKIRIEKNTLRITGIQRKNAKNYSAFPMPSQPCDILFDARNMSFDISLPIIRHMGLALIDMKSFNFDYNELKRLPDFEKDYIIVENKGTINYLITNAFVKLLLNNIN